jgi:hypothetical protein
MFDLMKVNQMELLWMISMRHYCHHIARMFHCLSMMDLEDRLSNHRLVLMNLGYLESCRDRRFDNDIHISNPIKITNSEQNRSR